MPTRIPTPCPNCQHQPTTIVVRSLTVMTVSCPNCAHIWAVDINSVSPTLRAELAQALKDVG